MSLHALFAARVLTPWEEIPDGVVLLEDATIRSVGRRADMPVPENARRTELGDCTLAPGFIDIHIHGGAGHDVMEAGGGALAALGRHLLRHGTTSYLPTTVSAPADQLELSLAGLGRALTARAFDAGEPGAEPLGLHLEGPFLSAACRGAHAQAHLREPSIELFERFRQAAGGWMRIMTLAPELPGAAELQAHAQRAGVKIGIGHSNATYEQAVAAIELGASHGVHVFNAMRGFAHRDPGILAALLTDDRVMAEAIADGIHVAPAALHLLFRTKGRTRTILVTDAVSATGAGPGRYMLGGMQIEVKQESPSGPLTCRNSEGALAGSVLTQDAAVRNMAAFSATSLGDAIGMVTANPARLLGLSGRKGSLEAGADADLAVLTADGQVCGSIARGRLQRY